MIIDIQPVTHIQAVSVYRQWFTVQRIQYHQGDQFLRKLIWAVIVRAIGSQCGKPVGVMKGADQMIRSGLGGGIRAVRCVGRGFREGGIVRSQRTIYLVGGYVQKPESGFFVTREHVPISSGFFQQMKCAVYIGLNEILRPVDGTVNMAFRREVHNGAWSMTV